MNGGAPDRHEPQMAVEGALLLEELYRFEEAIAAMAAAMSPEIGEAFIELAIDELLVDYARSMRSADAAQIHIALGRRLREGVRRRLDVLTIR